MKAVQRNSEQIDHDEITVKYFCASQSVVSVELLNRPLLWHFQAAKKYSVY